MRQRDDTAWWRERAEHARAIAERWGDERTGRIARLVAEDYSRKIALAAGRKRQRPRKSPDARLS